MRTEPCPNCHGLGWEECWYAQNERGTWVREIEPHKEPCWDCGGEGRVLMELGSEFADLMIRKSTAS